MDQVSAAVGVTGVLALAFGIKAMHYATNRLGKALWQERKNRKEVETLTRRAEEAERRLAVLPSGVVIENRGQRP